MLTGKKILVGVTGSIAAYKSAFLVRELIRLGADVRVVMTPASREFITPLTLSTLSKNPVAVDFVKPETNGQAGEWESHVELGLWADLFIIAPVSANTLSKMVTGQCDNLLMATYLSAKCPVWIAPAMDLDMYKHPSTQENLTKLTAQTIRVIDPTSGELASGLDGKGRMQEPEEIADQIDAWFNPASKLRGKKILITGGPTYEAIDPVRFIGNHSSGKTGVILADACANRGAEVLLITGPTQQRVKNPRVKVIAVTSADEMMKTVEQNWFDCTVGIYSAAVADYKPEFAAGEKIKKTDDRLTLNLVKNPDILKWAGLNKKKDQYLVGFALETENELENGTKKLVAKKLDLLVLNSLKDAGAGFGHDTNKVTFIKPNNKTATFELNEKTVLMNRLLDEIEHDL
ncbi:MAG: bifunctional phosphopantothenoylcysteine decarboxylase/phosphopantothenate--cysteine ligase CoaBC [Bacteroidetes bacterium]|nr:bifunctional phosphopantothenoylcysteine decarboxylase/phosphopantothenate--cysteine ligase CoaBC [Bacteroidota bacterium]